MVVNKTTALYQRYDTGSTSVHLFVQLSYSRTEQHTVTTRQRYIARHYVRNDPLAAISRPTAANMDVSSSPSHGHNASGQQETEITSDTESTANVPSSRDEQESRLNCPTDDDSDQSAVIYSPSLSDYSQH